MPAVRTFIAIETPDDVKDSMSTLQSHLKTAHADVRWETKEKLHATVKFLGDVQETVLPSVLTSIRRCVFRYPSFSLTYRDLGCFPNQRQPSVIWIGCHNGDGLLMGIKEQLDNELGVFGFEKEKRNFSPHVTLGRIKSTSGLRNLTSMLETINFEPREITVTGITVLRSVLKPQGSEYTILESMPLLKRHK